MPGGRVAFATPLASDRFRASRTRSRDAAVVNDCERFDDSTRFARARPRHGVRAHSA
jgi:hypothetical protein